MSSEAGISGTLRDGCYVLRVPMFPRLCVVQIVIGDEAVANLVA